MDDQKRQEASASTIENIVMRVPSAHKEHTDEKECDCCEDLDEAAFVCKCGAAYGISVFSFHQFYCYDCGRFLHKNYLNEARKNENQ